MTVVIDMSQQKKDLKFLGYRMRRMRRILALLLICLLPLQSFAGIGMGIKMMGTDAIGQTQMADAPQAACHEAHQPMQAASQDCCDMQGVCQVMCQLNVGLPPSGALTLSNLHNYFAYSIQAKFQSAELSAGFKPPLL